MRKWTDDLGAIQIFCEATFQEFLRLDLLRYSTFLIGQRRESRTCIIGETRNQRTAGIGSVHHLHRFECGVPFASVVLALGRVGCD